MSRNKSPAVVVVEQEHSSDVSLSSQKNNGIMYWEGPPAHFMLPTHAIHCRLSRSIERCPRACKGKTHMKNEHFERGRNSVDY